MCLFHRKDQAPITIKIFNVALTSKDHINVLGITFDLKLNWHFQVQNAVNKSKMALNAIYLIWKYFTKKQLLSIITSKYYSILYYNAKAWLLPDRLFLTLNPIENAFMPTLKPQLKQNTFGISQTPEAYN